MSRWPQKKLRNLAMVQMGQSPPGETYNTQGIGLPFFQGKAEFGEETPRAVKWCSKPLRIAEAGDILLSVRAPVGPTNLASERCCIGRGLAAIRADRSVCNQRYLKYALVNNEARLVSRGVGSTFSAISRNDIESLELSVPPLPEQERIVNLLDEADELRKLRARADRRTADLIPALFHEMFGDLEKNDKQWELRRIGEIASHERFSIRMGPFGSQLKKHELVKEGIKVLWIENVVDGRFQWCDDRCITKEKYEDLKGFEVKPGDLLITTMGTIGRCGVVPDTIGTAIISSHLIKITLNPDIAYPIFISEIVNSPYSARYYERISHGSIMRGLNTTIVKNLSVPIPPMPLQEVFAKRVADIRELEATQTASRLRLEALFQSLVHHAFNGGL